jgi:hypothetical protein
LVVEVRGGGVYLTVVIKAAGTDTLSPRLIITAARRGRTVVDDEEEQAGFKQKDTG